MSEFEFEVDSGHYDSDSSVEILSDSASPTPKLVFQDKNNSSIGFTFHKDVDEHTKTTLGREIKKHGGLVCASAVGADTLLITREQDKTFLQLACNSSRDKARAQLRVEFTSFIPQCIKRGSFRHMRPKIKPMHGVPEGNGRTAFSSADFDNLCWYISRLLPDPSAGGRQSLNFYSTLVAMGRSDPEYIWARRHTAESWKEHYKKNKTKYKNRIEELAKKHPPDPDRGWIHDRRLTKASLRDDNAEHLRREEEESESGEELQVEPQDEDDIEPQSQPTSRKRRQSGNTSATLQSARKRPRISKNDISSKGKEKAIETDESEEEPQDNFAVDDDNEDSRLFSDYGRSPERTFVASTSNQLSRGRLSFPTQETLVGTAPRPAVQLTGAHKQANMAIERPQPKRRTKAVATTSTPPRSIQARPDSTASSSPHMSPTLSEEAPNSRRLVFKAARRRPVQPNSPERGPAPQQPVQQASPRRSEPQPAGVQTKSKAGKKSRNPGDSPPKPVRASSRLRSIEPLIMPLPGRRNARKKQPNPIVEEQEEYESPIGETLAEEVDVVNQLALDALDTSAVLSRPEFVDRESSIDSDDALIADNLRAQSRRSNFDLLKGPQPQDLLKKLAQSSQRHSLLPSGDTRLQRPQVPNQRDDSHGPRKSAPPRTPLMYKLRGSSSESFPLPGTRAETILVSLQKRESGMSFTPLDGTKAAAYSRPRGKRQ